MSVRHLNNHNIIGLLKVKVEPFIELAKFMLREKNLSKKLWAEALNTAAYVLNRVPHKRSGIPPYEMRFGRNLIFHILVCFVVKFML